MTNQATQTKEIESKYIRLGKTETGGMLELDFYKLLETRALIQASSGGGKSWLLRGICEQTMRGGVPVWLIDPEGEYVSLREKFEVVIFGEEGDFAADAETLRSVLPELLRQNVSCVFDLSELRFENQNDSIVVICDTLISQPRKEWNPLLLALDEAQKLAPEGGSSPAMKAVADVASRGRKRGKGLIVATQRLSALDKNITTQLLNRFIGLCLEDVEIKRAEGYIGKSNAKQLLELNPGDFFALGSALSQKGSVKFRAGDIETSHPNSSLRRSPQAAPKASRALAKVIESLREKLINPPAESVEESKTGNGIAGDTAKLSSEIAELRRQVAAYEKNSRDKQIEELEKLRPLLEELKASAEKERIEFENRLREIALEFVERRSKTEQKALIEIGRLDLPAIKKAFDSLNRITPSPVEKWNGAEVFQQVDGKLQPLPKTTKRISQKSDNSSVGGLSRPEQKILDALALCEKLGLVNPKRVNVAFFAGYTENGHFNNTVGALHVKELLYYPSGGCLALRDGGRALANSDANQIRTVEDLHKSWLVRLSAPQGRVLRILINEYPNALPREDLAQRSGYTVNGHFNNTVGSLATLKIVYYPQPGFVAATDVLFPKGLR